MNREFIKHDEGKTEFLLLPTEFKGMIADHVVMHERYTPEKKKIIGLISDLHVSADNNENELQIRKLLHPLLIYIKLESDIDSLRFQELTAEVITFGKNKYSEDNWKKSTNTQNYINALIRHLMAYLQGEDIDPESGISHLGHIGCNIAFLLYFYALVNETKVIKKEV